MPVHFNSDSQLPSGNDSFDDAPTQPKPNVRPQRRASRKMREDDFFSVMDRATAVSTEGDYLLTAQESFKKALKGDVTSQYFIRAIPRTLAQIPYDVLVLGYSTVGNNVYIYPFVISDTMREEDTYPVYFDNIPREYVVTPDSIYDSKVFNKIQKCIKGNSSDINVYHVGFMAVPRNYDYENLASIKRLINNAVMAIDVVTNNWSHNSKQIKDINIVNNIRFAKKQSVTLHGRPIRSDLTLTLEHTKTRKKNKGSFNDMATSDDYIDQEKRIVKCDAFVDLVYSIHGNGGMFSNTKNTISKYTPKIIITNVEKKLKFMNMSMFLLLLASTSALQMNQNWAMAFKRPRGKALINEWHDIGAVSYEMNTSDDPMEHNFNKKIITNDPNFDTEELKKLVSKTFSNNFLISLDIEMGGPNIWLETYFSRAAYSYSDHPQWAEMAESARQYIVSVADEITDNAFSRYSGGGQIPIVMPGHEKIHLGVYEDENGEYRDIRDISYLTILNSCSGSNLDHIQRWANSFDFNKSSEGARLALREDMIRQITHGKVRFEALAKRVTFNPMFIQCLTMALMSKGIALMPMITEDIGMDDARYIPNYARFIDDINPMTMMVLSQNGIDLNKLDQLTPQQTMCLNMLGINPYHHQMEQMMHRMPFNFGKNKMDGYSCF